MSGDPIPTTNFTDPSTIRLISKAYIDEPALAPLADGEEDLAFLAEIEGLTSGRLQRAIPLPSGVAAEELLSEHAGYGWTYVNAAFCYTRTTGNRFNGPHRGAWYASWGDDAVETSHAEVSWHLSRELEAAGVFENVTAYRELIAGFTTIMHDLRSVPLSDYLDPDPDIGYPAGQRLAEGLRSYGGNGVLYSSARRAGGLCLAAFRPHVIQNIRQGDTWRFRWSGSPKPNIARV